MSNMNRNPKLLIGVGVALAVAAISLYFLPKLWMPSARFISKFRRPRSSERSFAVGCCAMLRNLLEQYYAQAQAATPEKNAEAFVNFTMNLDDWQEFTREPPPEGYRDFKVGFFFFLPNKLEGDIPAFIAYTTPVTDGSGKVCRLTLLLRGSKIETMAFNKQTVEGIFGSEQFKKEHPDLWAWRKNTDSRSK